MHNDSNVVTGGTFIENIHVTKPNTKEDRTRGKEKKKQAPKFCTRCKKWCSVHTHSCKATGRGRAGSCNFFDGGGNRWCGRCNRNKEDEGSPYQCSAALVALSNNLIDDYVCTVVDRCVYFDRDNNER